MTKRTIFMVLKQNVSDILVPADNFPDSLSVNLSLNHQCKSKGNTPTWKSKISDKTSEEVHSKVSNNALLDFSSEVI